MTVSPQWPQDGSRQPSVGGNGVKSDDSLDSPVLPPTLFELPNLRKEARGQARTDQPPANQTPNDHPTPVDQENIHPGSAGPQNSDDEPKSPAPPAVSTTVSTPASTARPVTPAPCTGNEKENSRSPERYPIPREQSTARSWMERIGSHGVVVVLLLVVIGAGLVIGRNSGDQEIDPSLADNSDLLDFDEGTELELPLPKHSYQQQTEIVAIAEAKSSAQSQEQSGLKQKAATSLSHEAVVNNPSVGSDINAGPPAAWLDDPRTDLVSTGQADAAGVEVNRVNDGSTANVEFVAASSRVPAESVSNALPTLDDLDDQPAGPGALSMPDLKTPARRLSKSPAPIIDWRLYLPREEPATADANVPFTSN